MATARPPVPPARPQNAIPRPPVSAVAPGPVIPAPVAPVAVAAVAPVVAPTETVIPTVPVTEKKKRGRKPGTTVAKKDLTPYHGTFVYDENGVAQCDIVDGASTPRRKKLETMPPLTGEGAFDPAKNEPLKVRDFAKAGDFFRHKSELMLAKSAAYLVEAGLADSGKSTKVGATVKLVKVQSQMAALLANLRSTMAHDDFVALLVKNGVDPAEFGIAA